jgi:hypothetical protein
MPIVAAVGRDLFDEVHFNLGKVEFKSVTVEDDTGEAGYFL